MTILGDVMSDDFNKSETNDHEKSDENPFAMAFNTGISERKACMTRREEIKKTSALWLAERLEIFEKIKLVGANHTDLVTIPNWSELQIWMLLREISGVDYNWKDAIRTNDFVTILEVSFGSSTLELKVSDVMKEVVDLIEQAGMDVTAWENDRDHANNMYIDCWNLISE